MSTADVDAVMKKYDRESNIRVWTGKYKLAIRGMLIAFSLWCIYVTLICNLPGRNSTDFFPGTDRSDRISDLSGERRVTSERTICRLAILFLCSLGTGAFLYFTFSANKIINQGTRFESYQIIIGIIGIAGT